MVWEKRIFITSRVNKYILVLVAITVNGLKLVFAKDHQFIQFIRIVCSNLVGVAVFEIF